MNGISHHQCLIYQGAPSQQLPALAALTHQMMSQNYRCLYLNSSPMVSGMRSSLAALGVNITENITAGHLVLASESTLSPDGDFDIDLMLHKLEDALDRSLDTGYAGLFATGDMTWEFGNKKNLAKLLEYEWRLEELFQRRSELRGLCQYHHDTLPPEIMRHGLLSHQTIFINETLERINPHYARTRVLSEQKSVQPELDEIILKLCQSQILSEG